MKRLLTAVVVACLVTACGGTSHQQAQRYTIPVVSQHVCNKADYAMGCALAGQPAPLATLPGAVFSPVQGVDFGWSCPLSQARSFGASYVSYDSSKDWTRSCVNAFHAAHKATVAVWEAGGSDAQGSYSLGQQEARQAASELAGLGAPARQPIIMAVDCDCAGSSLVNYFRGANAAEPGRIDAYGGYYQIQYLYGQHLVGHDNWQTYAWSNGLWLPASVAPLEQYLNSSQVDYDRAIAPYYGQWPYSAPAPSAPKCFGRGWARTALCNRVRQQDAALGQERNRELGYVKVSQQNAATVQTQITALQKKLVAIQARATLEQARATADNAQLEKSLSLYGYR